MKSSADGNFTSPPLASGAFTVTVEQQGFKRIVQTVTLDVDQHLFNKPQFDNPNQNGAGAGGGAIGLPTSGTLNYAGNPALFHRTSREIQLAVKIYF